MIRADLSLVVEAAAAAREVAARTDRIDLLINNAGGVGSRQRMTAEGNEATFAGNHLGPFVLTLGLLGLLRRTAASAPAGSVRILAVSSSGHRICPGIDWDDLQSLRDFTNGGAYTRAKLMNVLFTRELARRLAADGIVAHAMEPGVVLDSNFVSHADDGMQRYMATQQGVAVGSDHAAETLLWMATSPELGLSSGGYFHELAAAPTSAAANDAAAAERLWQLSLALAGRAGVVIEADPAT
jgi:NAD(P)-dependent dehydrogenase (short-subunit alcohol dehydrogenase family)